MTCGCMDTDARPEGRRLSSGRPAGHSRLMGSPCLFYIQRVANSVWGVILMSLLLGYPCESWAQTRAGVSQLYYRVNEEIETGTIIGDVVKDARLMEKYDSEILDILRFQFLTQPAANLSVDQRSGLVSTNGRLDRDVLCAGFMTCVVPLDVAIHANKFFQVIKATVEIVDLNDNAPRFPEPSIVFKVLESAPPGTAAFIVPEAIDPDSPSNAVKRYELVASGTDVWRLQVEEELDGSREVLLALTDTLDRETNAHYHLQVLAYDGGVRPPRSGSVDVYIEVQDANDNSPVFEKNNYEVTIDENTPLFTGIAQLRANDADWGANGQVVYSLSARSAATYGHLFGVNNNTGQVIVKGKVDYETGAMYHLTVVARDQGIGSVPSTASLLVNVRDLNDHAPHITVNTLVARDTNASSVQEDAAVGSFVSHVLVKDPDSGQNGLFNCTLQDRTFRLEKTYPGEYHILTSVLLDREKRSEYSLNLVCTDQGSPPQTAVKHIAVSVTDVNDNSPVFQQDSYSAELFENNYLGAYVTRVNATDKDEGRYAQIAYGLGPSDLAYFEIDSVTGIVTARDSLDREQRSEYNLKVFARDCGGETDARTATASLVVRILDVNDEKPRFSSGGYSFGVDENQPAGTNVGLLSAHDADSSPYNQYHFFLLPAGSLSDAFVMEGGTGVVRTTRPLDREEQKVYELVAVARDTNSPSLSSTATVSVYVMDLNDNPPTFTFPTPHNNTVQISHKIPLGFTVTNVSATDPDEGSNGKIRYQMTRGNQDGVFSVDPNTGIVSVNIDLRDMPDNRTWHLEISATDHGKPSLSASAALHIVLNRSLSMGGGSVLSGTNFIILLVVGCVAGLLIVVLLIVIVVLLRKQQLKRRRMHRYNCRMHALQRMAAQEMIADSSKKDSAFHNNKQKLTEADYTIIPKKEPDSFASEGNKDKMDLSHEKSRQWLETLEPNRYEANPTRGTPLLDHRSASESQGSTPYNGKANQPGRKETSTLPHTGNNPSPRPLSSVLEDSASDSVKSGEGSNTDSGRGHSDADGTDNTHSTGPPQKTVQFSHTLPPPPPAPQYQTLPNYHPPRYTRPPPHCQSFTSFRGNNPAATNNNIGTPEEQLSPGSQPQLDKTPSDHSISAKVVGVDMSNRSHMRGAETVAIKPQGSPVLKNAKRTPRFEDYHGNQDGGRYATMYNSKGIGVERETDC